MMRDRFYLTIGLLAEAIAFTAFGLAVALGALDDRPVVVVYFMGIVVVASILCGWVLPHPWLKRTVLHGALLLGSLIFALPIAWLISTTFKYEEEVFIFPPKWVPAIAQRPLESPWIVPKGEAVPRPEAVSPERWELLQPQLEEALSNRSLEILDDGRLDGLPPDDLWPALSAGVWSAASIGVSETTWNGLDAEIVQEVLDRLDAERVEDVWQEVYRAVMLRDLTFVDVGLIDHPPGPDATYVDRWKPVGSDAAVALRFDAPDDRTGTRQRDATLTVAYDLADSSTASIEAVLPMPVAADQLLGFSLPIREDRSWHRYTVSLEVDGKRYVPEDGFRLGAWRWQEITFKRKELSDSDQRDLGIWPLVEVEGEGAFDRPGYCRVTLTIDRASAVGATMSKYFDGYRQAFLVTEHRWSYVFNSLYLVVLNVLGSVISCSLVAFAFARLRWPGRDALFVILLATMMLPPQVTMIPVFIIFKNLGWYNTLLPLWTPSFFGAAFFIFLLRQFMKGIPVELEEAAKIDGCGLFGIYWRVILPLMKPALAAVAIFTFIGAWNDFLGPLIYLNDQRLYPLSLGLFDFRTEHNSDFRLLMAAATLMTLPVIAVFFLAQRYFIEGVTLTGLKG